MLPLAQTFDDHFSGKKMDPGKRAQSGCDVPALVQEITEWRGVVSFMGEMEEQ